MDSVKCMHANNYRTNFEQTVFMLISMLFVEVLKSYVFHALLLYLRQMYKIIILEWCYV